MTTSSTTENQQNPLAPHASHPSFIFKRSEFLKTLNLQVEEYEHIETGAAHYHLASENPENVFLVALRTVPMDDTGVAHILEHTALCGSKRFPVRDPFFMMIRRSMNTFMNAFTSSDWTAYPFASQNTKDFNNLLEVYLDAVFFSNLDELDFAQEGHRLEFSEMENPQSPLEYKGVVFNEMKGAMSSANSYIWQKLSYHLFPETTYHFNSGGDPAHIPELSYEQLKSFYKSHYHPSNAIFMTYGDIPALEHQNKIEELALQHFKKLDIHISVKDERRYKAPIEVTEYYPLDEEDIQNKSHIMVAWLLGKSTDLEALYKTQLLASVLLDNSASPLLQALETSNLGSSPSPLCGLEDSNREMSFICGLEGCNESATESVKSLILQTLQQVVRDGIPQDKVEAALHSLELHQREISGDSYPYGLQLILASLSTATHRGDPISLLDIDPVLEKLKEDIKDPSFITGLIQSELLDNPHRVLLTVHPDKSLSKQAQEQEKEQLAAIKSTLSEDEIKTIITQSKALEARQNQEDDSSILPKVELSDVPADIKWPGSEDSIIADHFQTRFYSQGTNGIAYQQIILPLPAIPPQLHQALALYTSCLPELGVGSRSYLDIQALQSGISGGISAYTSLRSTLGNEQSLNGYLILSSKGLYAKQSELSNLLQETFSQARFDEHQRIRELVQQISNRKEQSIPGQGHALAMGLACSAMSPISHYSFQHSGLAGIQSLKALSKNLEDDVQLENFCNELKKVHELIQQATPQFLLIADESNKAELELAVNSAWKNLQLPDVSPEAFQLSGIRESVQAAWITNTQVNFCSKAFPTVPSGHEDSAALTVLGGILRNGFLHKNIREQGGAYGGGATQDGGSASFRFFSYRDPRLEETLNDFDQSISWLLNNKHSDSSLEEAILGVISSLDKPASPAGTARQAYFNELFGRTKEYRADFRRKVLNLKVGDIKNVTEKYLLNDDVSIGIVSHKAEISTLEKLGLDIETL